MINMDIVNTQQLFDNLIRELISTNDLYHLIQPTNHITDIYEVRRPIMIGVDPLIPMQRKQFIKIVSSLGFQPAYGSSLEELLDFLFIDLGDRYPGMGVVASSYLTELFGLLEAWISDQYEEVDDVDSDEFDVYIENIENDFAKLAKQLDSYFKQTSPFTCFHLIMNKHFRLETTTVYREGE